MHGGVHGGGGVEAKSDAAMAILASACFLWDFFLSHEAHASLGLAQDDQAYVTLRELLGEGRWAARPAAGRDEEWMGGGRAC